MVNATMKQPEKFDILTRYFLRSLAIERRKKHINPETPYRNALYEVMYVAVGCPVLALFGFALMATLKWTDPYATLIWPKGAPMSFGAKVAISLGVTALVMLIGIPIGHRIFRTKFEKYRTNTEDCLDYGSDRDEMIFKSQKIAIGLLTLMVPAGLGLLVTYLAGG
jgi:hypothetical protein